MDKDLVKKINKLKDTIRYYNDKISKMQGIVNELEYDLECLETEQEFLINKYKHLIKR